MHEICSSIRENNTDSQSSKFRAEPLINTCSLLGNPVPNRNDAIKITEVFQAALSRDWETLVLPVWPTIGPAGLFDSRARPQHTHAQPCEEIDWAPINICRRLLSTCRHLRTLVRLHEFARVGVLF